MLSPKLLWQPSKRVKDSSNLTKYIAWLNYKKNINFKNYTSLWQWSVNNIEEFWLSIWDYFDILSTAKPTNIISSHAMPGVQWFKETNISYSEHIFRKKTKKNPALLFKNESTPLRSISWKELENKVASLKSFFEKKGIKKGDRVVAFLPNIPETIIAFLATNALGAIWSSTSPDFGLSSVVDRFLQIKPKLLITIDGYSYGGKKFDKIDMVAQLIELLPCLKEVVLIPYLEKNATLDFPFVTKWEDTIKEKNIQLTFTRVEFNTPIWILYSSGTTGKPKAITHSVGGVLLEHLKYLTLHNNIKAGEHYFWYTTTGWMMWNYMQASLLCGAVTVLYDGSPTYPSINRFWQFIEEASITHFGISASYVAASMKANSRPRETCNLKSLKSISTTGSPLSPEGFNWIYKEVKKDVWLASISGGTDICSAFVGGNPILPVYAGEIQCSALGCKLESYDENGVSVQNKMGEMVISEPMPSMPIYFWGDVEYKKYTESYFEMFPNKWRHGDWIEITPRSGLIIHGRSDSTLNRGGIRIGTSEIYRAIEGLNTIKDSLVIYLEKQDDMLLFVVLNNNTTLIDSLVRTIKTTIRSTCTPRHIPDKIIAIDEVPYTINGKKIETPIKKILLGMPVDKVINKDTLRNKKSIDFFIELRDNNII